MKAVELIANGYEWICPKCPQYLMKEIEITKTVKCSSCAEEYEVSTVEHAES